MDALEILIWMKKIEPKFVLYFFFNFIFKLYTIVLVLPNIEMNPPQVYLCSLSWTLLPPPSPYPPSGSSQCTSPKRMKLEHFLTPYTKIISPPFDSPFSPPGCLYFLPPPSVLYATLWISLCVPGCGEHLGNSLLAGSVSLLLIPPFILLATSISFLPFLFSV